MAVCPACAEEVVHRHTGDEQQPGGYERPARVREAKRLSGTEREPSVQADSDEEQTN